jgi:hypothetical protein
VQLQHSDLAGLAYRPTAADDSGTGSVPANQSTAVKLLLGCVGSALGLPGQTGCVTDVAAALATNLEAGLACGEDLAPELTQAVGTALQQVEGRLTAQGVNPAHVRKLVGRFRRELADALNTNAANGNANNDLATGLAQLAVGVNETPDNP